MHPYKYKCWFVIQCLFLYADSDLKALEKAVRRRKQHAFRPGTRENQRSQMVLFISFCTYFTLEYVNPSEKTLCLYAEFLARSFKSPRTIRNYISGIRLLHKYISVNCTSLHSFDLDLILRALDLTMQHMPNQRIPIDTQTLKDICSICDSLGGIGTVCKVGFLFGYFGFLRQSNLAPKRATEFDPKRHTCRGDILFHPPGLVILIKWTKTIQRGQCTPLIPLPVIKGNPLCPYRAYKDMLAISPTVTANSPLLQLPGTGHGSKTMTVSQLSHVFREIMHRLGYPKHLYSLHSLRAGGATSAYHAGVDFMHIKRHGTWKSDCFWSYIASQPVQNSPVAHALALSALT